MSGARHNRGRSKQDYATPMALIDAVKARLDIVDFTVDLAASLENHKAERWIDEETDALSISDWRPLIGDGWGWLNPPFNNITPWAERCSETAALGGKVAFLVPASVGSNWYRNYVHQRAVALFLNGRVPFMPDKPKWLFPKDCMVVLYEPGCKSWTDVWAWREQMRKVA